MSDTRPAPTARRAELVSIVLPVFNEQAALEKLHAAVTRAVTGEGPACEVIFVNDGSTDDSGARLDALAAEQPHVRVAHFSRNFGHQAAVQAGLSLARGDAVVVMDADFQDDPEAIPRFLAKWREGYDVVFAIRVNRKENPIKRGLFYAFYRLINAVSVIPMPTDAGNFGLVDRRVAAEIVALPDRDRYYAGLRCWVGHRQIGVEVERGARYDAHPRVSVMGLCRLAKSALFSFSSLPLALFYGAATLSLAALLFCWGFVLFHKLISHNATPGWTSTVMVACFFGCINAFGIAILGEYVLRIYDQVRQRPHYIIERLVEKKAPPPAES